VTEVGDHRIVGLGGAMEKCKMTWWLLRQAGKLAALTISFAVSTTIAARAETNPARVFACSIGAKRVSVTATQDGLVYHFGTATKDEMTVVGTPAAGNVFQMAQRYTGPEFQLRFKNGEYSYIVYSAEGNANVGASSVSGLVVMRGTKTASDRSCSRFTEFAMPANGTFAFPEDTEGYSAM
jgi:hypothetical protein